MSGTICRLGLLLPLAASTLPAGRAQAFAAGAVRQEQIVELGKVSLDSYVRGATSGSQHKQNSRR